MCSAAFIVLSLLNMPNCFQCAQRAQPLSTCSACSTCPTAFNVLSVLNRLHRAQPAQPAQLLSMCSACSAAFIVLSLLSEHAEFCQVTSAWEPRERVSGPCVKGRSWASKLVLQPTRMRSGRPTAFDLLRDDNGHALGSLRTPFAKRKYVQKFLESVT